MSDFLQERVDGWLHRALGVPGADEIEALFEGLRGHQLRLAESRITESTWLARGQITVRAVVTGRAAFSSTTELTGEGIDRCAADAVRRARALPEAAGFELPAPRPCEAAPAWALDEPTVALDGATKRAWLAPALAAHERDGLALAGHLHTGERINAVRSTTGVIAWHRGSFCDLVLSSLERPAGHRASAYRSRVHARLDRAELEALQEALRAECHRAHDPIAIEPGAWDVVLAPPAVAELLEWLGSTGFAARAVEDGTSFLAGREGERITGAAIDIFDDGAMPAGVGLPLPFDAEGQPRQRTSLIAGGIAGAPVYDTREAARAGAPATGHATAPNLFASGGGQANHLHLGVGLASDEALLGQVERGLHISRLHYVNGLIDTRRAVMTGLLRDATFLIEHGRLTRAVQPLRFTDSILEAFARVPDRSAIGRRPMAVGSWGGACTVTPSILVRGLQFSGRR